MLPSGLNIFLRENAIFEQVNEKRVPDLHACSPALSQRETVLRILT